MAIEVNRHYLSGRSLVAQGKSECYKPGRRCSVMVGNLLLPEIKELIAARDFNGLREVFKEWPPADLADAILDFPEDEQVIIFRVLPTALAADVFEYLGIEDQQSP